MLKVAMWVMNDKLEGAKITGKTRLPNKLIYVLNKMNVAEPLM